ncbi:hypothetical protein ABT126_29215 [Streptomyces sp. NPDC002012]|uniref:hypothetical protein n=1 Tax=Streptomyces sp. NPDC002012 TaxID=3154532 RepID=UPI00331E94BF
MAGLKIDKRSRGQIIETLKRAGLSHAQAVAIVDTGALPASLRSQIQALGKGARGFGGSLGRAFVAALRELDSQTTVGQPEKPQGTAQASAEGKPKPEAPSKQEQDEIVVIGPGDDDLVISDEKSQEQRKIALVDHQAEDFDYSDALGDLVGALNPFQSWSRTAFRVECTMTPFVSEATGEVKVTVTTETKLGVTVTTEVTKDVDEKAPTLVTQVTDTHTGEVLSDPITAKAPSVETVSAVALGQLARGLTEAREGQPAEQAAMSTGASPQEAVAPEPQASVAPEPQASADGRNESPRSKVADSSPEAPEGDSEAGNGLPSEPLGDLPEHAAA